ncbi:MAG: DUF1822 family protein [Leptolyngbyaceae cyanobacterium bins.59]|nr:DUF1822 family protein [Leptolyngbyaceae cyanobacterium bins.59]
MKTSPYPISTSILADFGTLQPETVALSPGIIQRSVQASRQTEAQGNGWGNYLTLLALAGFRQWLAERACDLSVNDRCGLLISPNRVGEGICTIEVQGNPLGPFKVGVLAIEGWLEDTIELPWEVIEQPDYAAQFYVLVLVQEEQGWVTVHSFLSADRLRQTIQLSSGICPISLEQFEPDPEQFLLYLQCLNPATVPLPVVRRSQTTLSGYTVYPLSTLCATIEESSLLHQGRQSLINTAHWLRDELDQVGRDLAWVLLPTLTPAMPSPMLSSVEELEAIVTELSRTGTPIPPQARGAYQDFQWADLWLRLYAMVWPLPIASEIPEWSLLLILGTPSGGAFPKGVRLQVSDPAQVLLERTLRPDHPDTYLYARVSGIWEETFVVTIAVENGATLTLPPFAFQME